MLISKPEKKRKRVAVIGGGPAGVFAAIFAAENPQNEVFIFDKNEPLKTLLPTGGGRCNLANAEFDFKELAKNYPRGEKFLYSVLSKFATSDTLAFFEKIGVNTYTQTDSRIFPVSDSSVDVREALLKVLNKSAKIRHEKVQDVYEFENNFIVRTQKCEYPFDAVIISTGGKGAGHSIARDLGHNVVPLKPALTSLKTIENDFYKISGVSFKNVSAEVFYNGKKEKTLSGDLLFTHFGVSGPLVYKISSYFAYHKMSRETPVKIVFNLIGRDFEEFDKELIDILNQEAKKDILNVISDYVPRNFASALFEKEKIDPKTKSGQLKKEDRLKISKSVTGLILNAYAPSTGEEIVTAGGVDLKEIDPKTMESKLIKNLYFCGEILDIDGLTGGFNLQNCWSTGFIAGSAV